MQYKNLTESDSSTSNVPDTLYPRNWIVPTHILHAEEVWFFVPKITDNEIYQRKDSQLKLRRYRRNE